MATSHTPPNAAKRKSRGEATNDFNVWEWIVGILVPLLMAIGFSLIRVAKGVALCWTALVEASRNAALREWAEWKDAYAFWSPWFAARCWHPFVAVGLD